MIIRLTLFLCLALSAFGQARIESARLEAFSVSAGAAGGAATFDVITNITGYPIYAWYVVDAHYGTTGLSSLTNLTPWTDAVPLDLTNRVGGAYPSLVSDGVNGMDYLLFDGTADYLTARGLTSPGSIYEWFLAVCVTNATDASIFSPENTYYNGGVMQHATGGNFFFALGGGPYKWCTPVTNQWLIINGVVNTNAGNNCALYTNGVSCGYFSDSTAANLTRLTIGSRGDVSSYFSNIRFAELAVYSTNLGTVANSGLCTGNRYTVTTNIATRYGITIPSP